MKDSGSRLFKIRSKGDRTWLAGNFSEDRDVLEE